MVAFWQAFRLQVTVMVVLTLFPIRYVRVGLLNHENHEAVFAPAVSQALLHHSRACEGAATIIAFPSR